MVTTIQLSEETKQMLESVKDAEFQPSYDAVVRHLLNSHVKMPESMFGKLPKRLRMTKRDKREFFHEL